MAKNRRMRILLLPILAILFLIGFAISNSSQPQRKTPKRQQKQPTANPAPTIEIGVLAPQEEQLVTTQQGKKKDRN